MSDEPTPAELEAARKLFAGACDFVAGAAVAEALPGATLPEVAFVGRSNVGKSSLVNALTGRKTLARVSRSPGRTQQINFFDLAHRLMLVDLPGYGFARVAKSKKHGWSLLAEAYLKGRPSLRRALVLIDARHGIKEVDREILEMLDKAAVSYRLVLTKADKIKPTELDAVLEATATEARKRPAAHPDILSTSAETGLGIPELRAAVIEAIG